MIIEDQFLNLIGIVLIVGSVLILYSGIRTYREEKRLAQQQVEDLKKIKRKLNA